MDSIPVMNYGSLSPTVNGACRAKQAPSDADQQLLDQLEEMWAPHLQRGLTLRHETGVLLNERYGSPEDRQPLGEKVMEMAAKRLHIPAPELNRMRWLALLFKSVEDLKERYPGVTNWTAFRLQLPQIKKDLGLVEAGPNPAPSKASVTLRGVNRSLDKLVTKLGGLDADPSEVEKDILYRGLQSLAEALPGRLGVRLTVKRAKVTTTAHALST